MLIQYGIIRWKEAKRKTNTEITKEVKIAKKKALRNWLLHKTKFFLL